MTKMSAEKNYTPLAMEDILDAVQNLEGIATKTPLLESLTLSDKYDARVFLKREDLQVVRSYKIRGAYNIISALSEDQKANGVVCASAGNHSQGVAYACQLLGIKGTIFMPVPTPAQKVNQTKRYGKEFIDIVLHGDTFDDAYAEAKKFEQQHQAAFIHPFDDPKGMAGQATAGVEILNDAENGPLGSIDYLLLPIGGGGFAAGVASYIRAKSPNTKIIGIEPAGAPAMKKSIEAGHHLTLGQIDNFVDGAAVKAVGKTTFEICRDMLDDIITVPEGKICSTILSLYNQEAIVAEPAGALSITALDLIADDIKGKKVVCVLSGGNNDITRMEEIKERSLLYEGYKHYFVVNFSQRAGALREFLAHVLGPQDDIAHFEYSKKTSRQRGPAVIGIELANKDDLKGLLERMEKYNYQCEYLNEKPDLLRYLI